MSKLKPLLIKTLQGIIDKLDTDSCSLTDEQIIRALQILNEGNNERSLSKIQMYTSLHLSRAIFDEYVMLGIIPRGQRVPGFKELSWSPSDLELAKENIKKYNLEKDK